MFYLFLYICKIKKEALKFEEMEKRENIGLYFGSFNPIHYGHLILANYIVENTNMDKICFVVSPHNPLKDKNILIEDKIRLELVRLAIEDNPLFSVSDIEFSLPKPSYTINTLQYLKTLYPHNTYSLIMGQDNLENFDKWKDYNKILDNYDIYVYPRENSKYQPLQTNKHIHLLTPPLINISSSYIRSLIKNKKDIRYLLPDKVRERIITLSLYR